MRIIYTDAHATHDCAGELKDGQIVPCVENPARARSLLEAVVQAGHGPVIAPDDMDDETAPDCLRKIHDPAYLAFLATVWSDWQREGHTTDILPLVWPGPGMRSDLLPDTVDGRLGHYAFDVGTPICAGTWPAVIAASKAALTGARLLDEGADSAFCLTRPPGHHAMPGQFGGYCFVNFAAVAAQDLVDRGAARVAILDVDYHGGNGTQAIFYHRPDILTVSIHADPRVEYPYFLGYADETGEGDGDGCHMNLPLPAGTDWAAYTPALEAACARVTEFGAQALVLSFGADTYEGDPLGRFRLTTEDYARLGQRVAALSLPTLVVMEGGYALDALGTNTARLLDGLGM